MTRPHARPAASLEAPASRSGSPLDPQMRAAGIMGRILDFFDALEACPDDALERVRGRLVDELESGRAGGIRAPHDSRRRNAVLTAALACVHGASREGRRNASSFPAVALPWAQGRANRETTAGEVMHRIHRVLDGVAALQDPADPEGRPRGVDVLAHMLRGPEPRTWTRNQQDFGRCALEWMKARVDEPALEGAAGEMRWSTRARTPGGFRPGPGGRGRIVLSA